MRYVRLAPLAGTNIALEAALRRDLHEVREALEDAKGRLAAAAIQKGTVPDDMSLKDLLQEGLDASASATGPFLPLAALILRRRPR